MLRALIDREQLFFTDVGKSLFEAQARANLSHEWRLVYGGQLLKRDSIPEDAEMPFEECQT